MHFLHDAPFRDRSDTVGDCGHLIKLADMAVGMGFEQNFVPIRDQVRKIRKRAAHDFR
jgi:hypothetical protein